MSDSVIGNRKDKNRRQILRDVAGEILVRGVLKLGARRIRSFVSIGDFGCDLFNAFDCIMDVSERTWYTIPVLFHSK